MKRLRVGVIGQGRSGYSIHVHSLGLMADRFEVAAVCDPIEERTREAKEKHGARTYTDYQGLLAQDDLDLVVVATPSHLRVPVATAAFEAGRNVLCEKPLARRAADVDALIDLAKKNDCFFAVYQQSRYAPYFQQVRKIIDSGILGRIVMIKGAFNGFARRWDWQTLQEYGGGNLLNTGPHPMDQVLQLFGTDIMPEVWCVMDRANTFGDAEDFVKVLLKGKDRPLIDLEISSCDAYPKYTYHVHGTLGGLTGTTEEMTWKYYIPSEAPEQKLLREPLEGRAYCREDLEMHEENWHVPTDQSNLFGTMAGKLDTNLRDAMTTGSPLEITPEQVRQQIAVMEECHRQNPLSRLGE